MSIYETDWSTFLSQDSVMKTDVLFKLVDSKKGVRAHRSILSFLSPVFRAQFCGQFEDNQEIEIKDAPRNVFLAMITYLYKKEFDFSRYEVEDLFELVKLADRYELPALMDIAKEAILKIELTKENLINVVNVATNYELLDPFWEVSASTKQRCADFITSALKSPSEVFMFLAKETTDQPALEDSLKLKLLKSMARCKSCGNPPTSCVNGKELTEENLVVGREVKVTRGFYIQNHGVYLEEGNKGKVEQVHSSNKTGVFYWPHWGSRYTISYEMALPNIVYSCGV